MSTERSFIVAGMAGSGIVVTESISGLRAKRGFSFAIGQLLAFILLQQAISGENKKKQTRCPRGFETCKLHLEFSLIKTENCHCSWVLKHDSHSQGKPCIIQEMTSKSAKSKKVQKKLPWSVPMPKDSIIARRKRAALKVKTTGLTLRVRDIPPWSARTAKGSVMSSVMNEHDVLQPDQQATALSVLGRLLDSIKRIIGY